MRWFIKPVWPVVLSHVGSMSSKAAFTPLPSELVRPPRVKESPVQLECKVIEIKELGTNGGAGNLVICEIIKIHISEKVLNQDNQIDTKKIDLVARMGDNWYVRANGPALFEVQKPITTIGIGIDQLPESIRNSQILSGNNLGLLASVEQIPEKGESKAAESRTEEQKHMEAKQLLAENKVLEAWQVLLT